MSEAIPKRSVIVAGHRTSVSLEEPFWSRLKEIARQRNMSINDLVTEIDASETATGRPGNLSSALRLHVLSELERRLTTTVPGGGMPPTPVGAGVGREPGA